MRRLQGNSKHIQVRRLGAASTVSHAPNKTERKGLALFEY